MTSTIAERIVNRQPEELPPVLTGEDLAAALDGTLGAQVEELLRQRAHEARPLIPNPRIWCTKLAPALLECMEGKRSPLQLRRYLDDDPYGRVSRRFRTAARRGIHPRSGRVIRVRTSQPCPSAIESVIVAELQGRITAIAMRLEDRGDRWVVTVLQVL